MELQFNKIINGTIFDDDFKNLNRENGLIRFKETRKKGGTAVVYAPNGTGKSSFANVLKNTEKMEKLCFEAIANEEIITPQDKKFHVIENQIDRNIIPGNEKDYMIGKNIRREFELKDSIDKDFENKFTELKGLFRHTYKINKKNAFFCQRDERRK